jgi:hypothetical protein
MRVLECRLSMLGGRPLCGIKVPEPSMGEVSTIGQVHGVDESGAVVMRKRVSRSQVLEFFGGLSPCLIGIEACSSAHYWSR